VIGGVGSYLAVATTGASGAGTALPKVTIAMNGHSIKVGGALVSAAVQVVMTTTNEAAGQCLLFRMNKGVTSAQAMRWANAHPNADLNAYGRFGSFVFDAGAPKGRTTRVQTVLQAADYIAFDVANPNPKQEPHTTFTVAKSSKPATLPRAPRVRAIEFGFRGSAKLHRGSLVRFSNDGYLVHMIVGVHTKNDADARQVMKDLKAGKDRAAQQLALGFASFMGPVSHGAVQQEVVRAPAGTWVLACFMDTQDGREHTQLGMERIIHITA